MEDNARALLDFMTALLTSDRANAAAARARKEAITSTQYRDVMQRQEEHIAQVRSDAVADRMEYLIAEVRERFGIEEEAHPLGCICRGCEDERGDFKMHRQKDDAL